MSIKCAWCRSDSATRKVAFDEDESVECYRFFCNAQHQANWETNQPRPSNAPMATMVSAAFFEMVKEANLNGWNVLNCFQFGVNDRIVWRVNLQKRKKNGATVDIFTEYEDHADPRLAMKAAYASALARDAVDKKRSARQTTAATTTPAKSQTGLTEAQEKRLFRALDSLFFAVMMDRDGTRSKNRTDDL